MNTSEDTYTYRRAAVIVGVLFIIATAFLFIGQAFYKPILTSPDYLALAYPQRTTVILGILLELLCVLAIPLIAVFLFPVLKKYNEALALAYLVFRILEAVILIGVAEINKLALIGISQEYLASGAEAANFEAIGGAVQAANVWGDAGGLIYNIVFIIGAFILYAVLYRSKLVPRWISVWGLLAAAAILAGTLLSPFFQLPVVMEFILVLPIAVQEMVMAVWLIVKGFYPAAIEVASIDPGSRRVDMAGTISPSST